MKQIRDEEKGLSGLGLRDKSYQDLYHFGAGKPVEDKRIATLRRMSI